MRFNSEIGLIDRLEVMRVNRQRLNKVLWMSSIAQGQAGAQVLHTTWLDEGKARLRWRWKQLPSMPVRVNAFKPGARLSVQRWDSQLYIETHTVSLLITESG